MKTTFVVRQTERKRERDRKNNVKKNKPEWDGNLIDFRVCISWDWYRPHNFENMLMTKMQSWKHCNLNLVNSKQITAVFDGTYIDPHFCISYN